MTYKEIAEALHDARLYSLLSALERCVGEETEALANRPRGTRNAGPTAENFYADEITAELAAPSPLTPDEVLSLRRRANVWAIAAKMRDAGIGG